MVRLYNNLIFFLFIIIANKCTLLHLFVLTLDILILYNYNEGEVMKEYVLLVPNSIKKEIIYMFFFTKYLRRLNMRNRLAGRRKPPNRNR